MDWAEEGAGMRVVWKEGSFLQEGEFRVSPVDRSLCHGLNVFETVLAVRGRVHLLGEHLRRLRAGLNRWGVGGVDTGEGFIRRVLDELLRQNSLQDRLARVRISVSLGVGGLGELGGDRSWMWITADEVVEGDGGIFVGVCEGDWAGNPAKVGNYADNIWVRAKARAEGFDDGLIVRRGGEVVGGAMANIFGVGNDQLFTPSLESGCLDGVTRRFVIDLLKENGSEVIEKRVMLGDLAEADGIFFTSSLQGPIWVRHIAGLDFAEQEVFRFVRESWRADAGFA